MNEPAKPSQSPTIDQIIALPWHAALSPSEPPQPARPRQSLRGCPVGSTDPFPPRKATTTPRQQPNRRGARRPTRLHLTVTASKTRSSKRQLPPKRPLRSCPVRPTRSASPCYPRSSLTGPPIARGVNFALAAPQRTRRGGPAVGRSSRRAVASPLRTPLRTNAKPPRKHASRTRREQLERRRSDLPSYTP